MRRINTKRTINPSDTLPFREFRIFRDLDFKEKSETPPTVVSNDDKTPFRFRKKIIIIYKVLDLE